MENLSPSVTLPFRERSKTFGRIKKMVMMHLKIHMQIPEVKGKNQKNSVLKSTRQSEAGITAIYLP